LLRSVLAACLVVAFVVAYSAQAEPVKIRLSYVVPVANWSSLLLSKPELRALSPPFRLSGRISNAFDKCYRCHRSHATGQKIADDFTFRPLTTATRGLALIPAQPSWRVPKPHDST
jgi:hypothetical protein